MGADDEPTVGNFPPTPAVVLGWIAASGERAWFPAAHAQQANVPRESLDDPIAALRHAGLIRVQDWVKGLGQGYAVTPDGAPFVHDPQKLAKLLAVPRPTRDATPDPPTTFDRGEEARQALFSPRPPLVVQLLIVLNVLWFVAGLAMAVNEGRSGNAYLANGDPHLLERLGAVSGPHLVRGEWWRLVTTAFVHIGVLHLIMNMYALASVGALTESIWGRRRFTLLYFASAVGGSCLATGLQPIPLLAGASGAIWGLTTSLAAWLLLHRQHLPPPAVNQSLQRLGVLFVINIAVSFIPGVSWACHFGGGLVAYAERSERWLPLRAGEHRRQRAEFLQTIQGEFGPIDRPVVDTLYRQVMEAVRIDPNRRPGLPAQVAKLRADAQTFADDIAARPWPEAEGLPDRCCEYAAAVGGLADAMRDALRNPDAGVAAMKERKKAVDGRWAALFGLSLGK